MASIKVFDPVSVPLPVLEESQRLRAEVERLRQENERLRRELEAARAGLDQAQRQSKRQAAPFSKGPPKPQPRRPGRKSFTAHGRHGHRPPPSPAAVDEVLEALQPHAWVTRRATGYAIDPHRKADVLERVIGLAWSGTMIHDGFASYDRFEAATHQQCLGHVLRRVRELEAQATRGAVHYPRKLIALFTEAIHLRNQYEKGEVSAEQLGRARPKFDQRLGDLAWPAREVPAYETLSAHLWKYRDEWFTFLSRPEVERMNWEGEQAIRPAVVNRKVWGGNRTWVGARAQELLMSVLETCRRAGCSGLEFVSQTLRAFPKPLLPRPILLTPR